MKDTAQINISNLFEAINDKTIAITTELISIRIVDY